MLHIAERNLKGLDEWRDIQCHESKNLELSRYQFSSN